MTSTACDAGASRRRLHGDVRAALALQDFEVARVDAAADRGGTVRGEERQRLLTLADEHEPSLALSLRFLLATGCRRGEAVALATGSSSTDADDALFERAGGSVSRPAFRSPLDALLMARRREALERRWQEVPPWVFCSSEGTMLDDPSADALDLRTRASGGGN